MARRRGFRGHAGGADVSPGLCQAIGPTGGLGTARLFHVKHDPSLLYFEDFQLRANVSRETLDKLQVYADLLLKWQASINLVGPGTVPEIWHRHFYDLSAAFPYLISDGPVIDMGSGAGFPGLVLAAMGRRNVILIESNGKKCSFLRDVNRQLSLDVTICQARIEACGSSPGAQYVVSRALAPLDMLLFYAHPLLADDGTCLFLRAGPSKRN